MNIIIPMAGMGKRLRPHTLTTAKPLLPIAGKPIVQRLVEDILATCNTKVDNIAFIIAPQFGKDVEKMLLNISKKLGAKGHICYQEEALGTAHAILCAGDLLSGNVFIAFADTLFKANFSIDTKKDAIIWTQKVEDPSAYGVVICNKAGLITRFVEKPKDNISNLAIIGVYYFKDGANLRKELLYLIDNDIKEKGEYQLTNAMENMKNKKVAFYTDQVEEWLDCGNKDAMIHTNQRILTIKCANEKMIGKRCTFENSAINGPCFIGDNVVVRNSVIGPYVSLEANVVVDHSVIQNSIIQENASIKGANIIDSMVGKFAEVEGTPLNLSIGDYSTKS